MKYAKCTPINGKDAVLIAATLVRSKVSEKAYLVKTDHGLFWVPKKVANRPHFSKHIMAVEMWYFEKELNGKQGFVE